MSNIPDREFRLAYVEAQMETTKLWVSYHLALATANAVTRKDDSDTGNVDRSFQTARRHILKHAHAIDVRDALLRDDLEAYDKVIRDDC